MADYIDEIAIQFCIKNKNHTSMISFVILTCICINFSEKSAASHSITWLNAISAKPVQISGAVAFAVSGQLRCLYNFML